MTYFHSSFRLSILLLLAVLLNGCTASTKGTNTTGQPAASQELRVGVSTNAPPLIYKSKRKITGLEAEFAQGLANHLDRKLRFVPLKWKDQIPSLLAGKIDIIMSGMTITKSRSYRIAFTTPYMTTGQLALVRRNEFNRLSNGFVDMLNPQVQLGTVTGTTGDDFVASNKARGARTQYASSKKGVEALIKGSIDSFIYDLPGILYYASVYSDKGVVPVMVPMTRENLAWGVRPDDKILLQEANNYIESIRTSGRLQQLIERWIPFYKNLFNKR